MNGIDLLRAESLIALVIVAWVFALTFREFASARRPFSDHTSLILLILLIIAGTDLWVATHIPRLSSSNDFAIASAHARRYLIMLAALGTVHLYRRVTR